MIYDLRITILDFSERYNRICDLRIETTMSDYVNAKKAQNFVSTLFYIVMAVCLISYYKFYGFTFLLGFYSVADKYLEVIIATIVFRYVN